MNHRKLTLPLLLSLLLLAGCGEVWAQGIANQVSNDLEKIDSYTGRTIEHGLADEPVTRDIVYQNPWRVRVETLTPAAHAGELFLYDGDRMVYWWPKSGFGVEIKGATTPSRNEIRAHIRRLTQSNLHAYAFSLRSERRTIAAERANEWKVIPTRKGPMRRPHRVWTHAKYSVPLKVLYSGQDRPWYSMEYESLDFDAKPSSDAFAFAFPDNAIVFRWDLRDEGVSEARARELMNFKVRSPTWLPKGHAVQKILTLENALPMLIMIMDRGATSLSLMQSRNMGIALPQLGKSIELGDTRATLSFLGPYSSITWTQGDTLLTLSGNLSFSELIRVAKSVK